MGVKDRFKVQPIPSNHTHEWILRKHYAKRLPPISYAFGLYEDNKKLRGVCTFGIPASRFEDIQQPYELNRLVVDEGLEKNVLSFFVSQCLKMFPRPNVIVSYADPNNGHHGYIYQATNWLYTGLSSAHHDVYINGQLLHEKSIFNMYGTNGYDKLREKGLKVEVEKQIPKYRYLFLVGDDKWIRDIKLKLKYPILPYPKGDNERYDASYKPSYSSPLF